MRPLLREAVATTRAQPVASALAVVMVAAMTALLLLTIGRTEGAAREVRSAFDDAGTRTIVMQLLLAQTAITTVAGAVVGNLIALTATIVLKDPLPAPDVVLAIDLLAFGLGMGAAVLPAIAAAKRDPITELRVP